MIAPNQKAVTALAATMNKDTSDYRRLYRDPDIVREVTKQLGEHGKKANLSKTEIPTKVRTTRRPRRKSSST